jgi:uncharacterized protein YbaA (DUF1428 family)
MSTSSSDFTQFVLMCRARKKMPFDSKRMAYGGFKVMVDV